MPRSSRRLMLLGSLVLATAGAITQGAVEAERSSAPVASSEASRFGLLSVGEYYACAVKLGEIYCWGGRDWDTPSSSSPSKLTYGDDSSTPEINESTISFDEGDVLDLSVGGALRDSTACAVTDDGTTVGAVWCWGMNRFGQFGDGTSPTSSQPPTRAFGGVTGAIEVGVGSRHVCVLFGSGQVRCAGDNEFGQLGDGSTTDSLSPVDAEYTTSGSTPATGPLGSVSHLLVGNDHNCALLDVGGSDEYAPWCWGSNDDGQLSYSGGSYETRALQPFLPTGVYSVVGAQLGPSSTCIWSSTTAWCAGLNYQSSTDNNTPHLGTGSSSETIAYFGFGQVSSFSGSPAAMAMGIASNCALRSDGTVRCWGDNRDGWLGDGTTTDNASGAEVLLPGPVDVIESGTATACAADRVGRLWCWGSGNLGATGTGSSVNRSTPTLLDSGDTGWTYLSTPPSPAITVTSTVSIADDSVSTPSGRVDAGDTAQVSYQISNTGDTTLNSITLTDTLVGSAEISCPTTSDNTVASLSPAASVTCTADVTITQADIDRGDIESSASVASANPATSGSGTDTLAFTRTASLTVTSSSVNDESVIAPSNQADTGDTVAVTHTIENTGNVTLTSITVADTLFADTDITCDPSNDNTIATLAPGATTTCTATHTLTQTDLDAGAVTSNATATGTAPSGATDPSDATDTATATITRIASLTVDSNIGSPVDSDSPANGTSDIGDTIAVTHTIENTGNVTLTSITVTDTLFTDTDIVCDPSTDNTIATLAPGATTTCTATHTLTQTDIDTGAVTSNATATGTAPSGATDPSDATDTATATISPTPSTTTTTPASATDNTSTTPTTLSSGPAPVPSTSTTTPTSPADLDLAELATSLPIRSITRSIVPIGSTIELNDTGYAPGETVIAAVATRRPKVLAQTLADADGSAAITAALDNDLIGEVVIIMVGESSGHGSQQSVVIEPLLPTTGTNSADATAMLLLAIAGGGLISLTARRRL